MQLRTYNGTITANISIKYGPLSRFLIAMSFMTIIQKCKNIKISDYNFHYQPMKEIGMSLRNLTSFSYFILMTFHF